MVREYCSKLVRARDDVGPDVQRLLRSGIFWMVEPKRILCIFSEFTYLQHRQNLSRGFYGFKSTGFVLIDKDRGLIKNIFHSSESLAPLPKAAHISIQHLNVCSI